MKRTTIYTQNWSAKLLVVLASFGIFAACEPPTGIGVELQGELPIQTYLVDTLTVNTSTVWQDSAFTSNAEGVVLGAYSDPIFGNIRSTAYTQLNLPLTSTSNTSAFKFDLNTANLVFDSVGVVMRYNSMYIGDTTQKMKLAVHRLTGAINDQKRYISTESIPYNSTILGQREIGIRDLKNARGDTTKSIRIVLNKVFGQELWDLANKETVLDIKKFTEYLQGLAIVPSADSKMAANFLFTRPSSNGTDVFSHLSLYYHEKDATTRQSVEFTLSRVRFTGIDVVRNGVPLNQIYSKGRTYSGASANNRTFVQGGVGLTTRIEIPYLKNLQKSGKIAINRAELVVEPAAGTITENYKVPFALQVMQTEKSENLQLQRNAIGQAIGAGPNSFYDKKTNEYVFSLTSYMQQLFTNKKSSTSFVIIVPSNDDLSRLVLNSSKTRVKIYYTLSK